MNTEPTSTEPTNTELTSSEPIALDAALASVFTVPRGTEHKPYAPKGARILLFEPTGTPTVGDRHEEVPDHVDATTGHALSA